MGFFDLQTLLDSKYQEWVIANYLSPQQARLKCAEATQAMVLEFPELTRVRGLAHVEEPFSLPPTRTPHWWCVDTSGIVVDPTAHQYPTRILKYEPVDESLGEPSGKCPNCGNFCYEGNYLCSKFCETEYMAYLNGGC